MALALAMVLQATPTPAVAVTGYDSAFLFESDWLIVKQGESGQAAVTFLNVGSVSWQKGGASQVNLATCCPLNSPPTHAAWAVTWLSSTAYATHREDLVAPGGRGTYIWNFKAPDAAAVGIYDFPGDLVLASTGEAIHREGYFHRNDLRVAAPTLAPTKLELTPETAQQIVGQNITLSAVVTADPETGSTTRRAVANAEVTFIVDAASADTGNSDFTRTATTDANGVAQIAYTRNNPGTDTVTAYVTTSPTVRDTSTVKWGVAFGLNVTPDDSVSLSNSGTTAEQCRSYSVTSKNPSTGAVDTASALANFNENLGSSTDKDGMATINGSGVAPTSHVTVTFDSTGAATIQVCGNTSTKTVTPIVFRDPNTNHVVDSGEPSDTGGAITFQDRLPVFTVTPDDTTTLAAGAQRVYTISAVDQFGAKWTKAFGATIGFVELTDDVATTTTDARIAWFDNDGTNRTTPASGSSGPPGATAPSGTTAAGSTACGAGTDADLFASDGLGVIRCTITLDANGTATFAIYSNSTTNPTGAPVVWYDKNTNGLRETDEKSDSGGAATFATANLTSCTISVSPSGAQAPTSATADPVTSSRGDVTFTFRFRDQGGNAIDPTAGAATATVSFSVTNTGNAAFEADTNDTSVNPGSTATFTKTTTGVSAMVVLDSASATSASASATSTAPKNQSTTDTVTVSCGPSSVTWVSVTDEPVSGTVTGTVVAFTTNSTTTDGGWYILDTGVGKFFIDYATDAFIVTGTNTNEENFESKLSVGDTIKFTGPATHDMTTNAP